MATDKAKPGREMSKAALLMVSLEEEVLAKVLKHLSPEEVSRVTRLYQRRLSSGEPATEELLEIGREFLHGNKRNPLTHLKQAVDKAFGAAAFDQIMREDNWHAISERVDAEALAAVLAEERPRAIAIVMSQLPPGYAAEVLTRLPEALRLEALMSVLRDHPSVEAPALAAMARALEEKFAHGKTTRSSNEVSSVQRVAAWLNQLDPETAAAAVTTIAANDAALADAIRNEMFTFENLLELDDLALQNVLSKAKPERIALALKGLPEEQRKVVFAALPEAVTAMVKEEIQTLGRVPLREAQAARRELIELALTLDRDKKIHIRAEEDMVE